MTTRAQSVEPPMVDLGKFVTHGKLPDFMLERAKALGVKERLSGGGVLSTRDKARAVVQSRPEVEGTVYLKADKITIVTPSFFDELLKAWPGAQLAGANEDVRATFNLVREKRGNRV